ncbi:MAG TPA: succinate CoA transferase [Taishania sp.]|nr:succinate CoA transferase [Taishania sp.]
MDDRIKYKNYLDKVITAEQAANLIENNMFVGSSGFTKSGDSKAVLPAFAKRAENEDVKISLITGASLGHTTDTDLANNNALSRRMPFQLDGSLRNKINEGAVMYMDQHLSESAEMMYNNHLPELDLAIIEATYVDEKGNIIPTTSVGNSATFAQLAKHIIIEVNAAMPLTLEGIHDVAVPEDYPNRKPYEIVDSHTRIGKTYIEVDPSKVIGIVFTEMTDSHPQETDEDEVTDAIAEHLITFFNKEIAAGRLTTSLMPLQAGIGKVANAVLAGFAKGNFDNLTMYSEVLQDSTFELIDAGKLNFASASSLTLTKPCYEYVLANMEKYKDKILLRPQNISNAPEVIRRLGVIAINTAIEFDIYGNVNSTHISGTKMMNGIGGSGDFARNAYLSIFVSPSISKNDTISHVVPMVSHTDHTEHDADILVTDQGLADLRGLAPRERAKVIIENCIHPTFKAQMEDYFNRALERGGHTPHILEEAFSWHTNLRNRGTMKL